MSDFEKKANLDLLTPLGVTAMSTEQITSSITPIYEPAIKRGLSIIPIPPREKGCKLERWPELASNDASIMDGLADHNYGVVANDTFCILDVDDPEAFRAAINIDLPATYTVKTSRGKHLYFRHTERSRKIGSKGAGIFDFQADRKYVVGEGSTHPSGYKYTCIDDSPIIEIPDLLVDALSRYVGERKIDRKAQGLKAGDRQDMLDYAGRIFTRTIKDGELREEMLEMLHAKNEADSEVLLSDGDLARMVQSAFKSWEPVEESGPVVFIGKELPVVDGVTLPNDGDWDSRLEIERTDYIDVLADELTKGTPLPFSYARETLKMLLLAGVPSLPLLPWYKTLHPRQYIILLSDEPGVGKGETWRRCVATLEKAAFPQEFTYEMIDGDGLGSPEYSVVRFGGEVKKHGKEPTHEPHIAVQITSPRNVVYYDEGKKLALKDQAAGSSGLVTMYTKLFDSNRHAMGSIKNGTAVVLQANVSLMLHFVREAFDLTFAGTGVTADGFLSRCTFVADYRTPLLGDWRIVDSAAVADLMEHIRQCMKRATVEIAPGVERQRTRFVNEMRQWEPKFRSRLEFLFNQDLLARGLFSPNGRIDDDTVDRAAKWTRHQYETRMCVYPLDASPDKREQMGMVLRNALEKHSSLTRTQLMKFRNVNRLGSGGYTVFSQVFLAMGLVQIGKTRKGAPLYSLPE